MDKIFFNDNSINASIQCIQNACVEFLNNSINSGQLGCGSSGFFKDYAQNSGLVPFSIFFDNSCNFGVIVECGIFSGQSNNLGIVSGNASFNENSINKSGCIYGTGFFYDGSVNSSEISNGIFNLGTINSGISQNATFLSGSLNFGCILGVATSEAGVINSGSFNSFIPYISTGFIGAVYNSESCKYDVYILGVNQNYFACNAYKFVEDYKFYLYCCGQTDSVLLSGIHKDGFEQLFYYYFSGDKNNIVTDGIAYGDPCKIYNFGTGTGTPCFVTDAHHWDGICILDCADHLYYDFQGGTTIPCLITGIYAFDGLSLDILGQPFVDFTDFGSNCPQPVTGVNRFGGPYGRTLCCVNYCYHDFGVSGTADPILICNARHWNGDKIIDDPIDLFYNFCAGTNAPALICCVHTFNTGTCALDGADEYRDFTAAGSNDPQLVTCVRHFDTASCVIDNAEHCYYSFGEGTTSPSLVCGANRWDTVCTTGDCASCFFDFNGGTNCPSLICCVHHFNTGNFALDQTEDCYYDFTAAGSNDPLIVTCVRHWDGISQIDCSDYCYYSFGDGTANPELVINANQWDGNCTTGNSSDLFYNFSGGSTNPDLITCIHTFNSGTLALDQVGDYHYDFTSAGSNNPQIVNGIRYFDEITCVIDCSNNCFYSFENIQTPGFPGLIVNVHHWDSATCSTGNIADNYHDFNGGTNSPILVTGIQHWDENTCALDIGALFYDFNAGSANPTLITNAYIYGDSYYDFCESGSANPSPVDGLVYFNPATCILNINTDCYYYFYCTCAPELLTDFITINISGFDVYWNFYAGTNNPDMIRKFAKFDPTPVATLTSAKNCSQGCYYFFGDCNGTNAPILATGVYYVNLGDAGYISGELNSNGFYNFECGVEIPTLISGIRRSSVCCSPYNCSMDESNQPWVNFYDGTCNSEIFEYGSNWIVHHDGCSNQITNNSSDCFYFLTSIPELVTGLVFVNLNCCCVLEASAIVYDGACNRCSCCVVDFGIGTNCLNQCLGVALRDGVWWNFNGCSSCNAPIGPLLGGSHKYDSALTKLDYNCNYYCFGVYGCTSCDGILLICGAHLWNCCFNDAIDICIDEYSQYYDFGSGTNSPILITGCRRWNGSNLDNETDTLYNFTETGTASPTVA